MVSTRREGSRQGLRGGGLRTRLGSRVWSAEGAKFEADNCVGLVGRSIRTRVECHDLLACDGEHASPSHGCSGRHSPLLLGRDLGDDERADIGILHAGHQRNVIRPKLWVTNESKGDRRSRDGADRHALLCRTVGPRESCPGVSSPERSGSTTLTQAIRSSASTGKIGAPSGEVLKTGVETTAQPPGRRAHPVEGLGERRHRGRLRARDTQRQGRITAPAALRGVGQRPPRTHPAAPRPRGCTPPSWRGTSAPRAA